MPLGTRNQGTEALRRKERFGQPVGKGQLLGHTQTQPARPTRRAIDGRKERRKERREGKGEKEERRARGGKEEPLGRRTSIPGWLDFSLPSNLCSDVAFSGRSTLDTGLKTATSRVPLPCCVFYSTSVQSLSRVRLSATPWDCSTPGFPVYRIFFELSLVPYELHAFGYANLSPDLEISKPLFI